MYIRYRAGNRKSSGFTSDMKLETGRVEIYIGYRAGNTYSSRSKSDTELETRTVVDLNQIQSWKQVE